MKLDRRPANVKIDIPMSELSTVNFTQGLLELVMTVAGTTEVRSAQIRDGLYVIGLGNLRFQGKDAAETFRKLLFWLLTNRPTLSPEEYAEEAKHVFEMEDEDTKGLIEELTKDGMSDFGQKVQEYRMERGAKIVEALSSLEKDEGHPVTNVNTLQDEIKRRTGYDDLDTKEVLAAIVDLRKMNELFDPAMVNRERK